ncbi:beta-glucoside-specific PTS transporter subunit IIABC [Herbiconiux sp. L3-i23]|uniref:beta-glucoside-specific PTS transporter subunit IIABC n=1 Tax=Herbiconiux sp. L3-i23 TaxID=2905871 RepID=UPI00205E2085|nr:beta-glucoside-specific PTS transporter subunit IIABC [Herbiconiux sp. L3-i23]BDI22503.1 PTS beta-glucoside transporter subunit EIIBCA [Herbiconiux sp. L3-i23]
MTTQENAKAILENVGGAANISNLHHCSTRLRFALNDETKVDADALKAIPGVIGVVTGAQTQVIVGTAVADVYRAVEKERTSGGSGPAQAGGGAAAPKRGFSWKRTGSAIMDFVVSVFTPIIPAIAGAGIFKSLLVLASAVGWLATDSDDYRLLSAIPDAVFGFLPLLVAYTSAKKLDVNRPVALGLVGVLVFPAFTALLAQEGGVQLFGLTVPNVNYNAQVFPAILAVLALWGVERFFMKITWSPIRTFFVPLMCFIIVAPIMIFLLGPLGYFLGSLLTSAMLGLYSGLGWVAVALMAAILPLIISVGMHKAFIPPTIATVGATGRDPFYLVASLAHNLSEAGANLAVAVRTKNTTLRATALSGGISALFGITEPALYGVTLQNRRTLAAVIVGSLSAGTYLGLTQVAAFAVVSPGLASFSMFVDALNPMNIVNAAIGLVIAVVVSFVVSALLWRDSDSGTIRALNKESGVEKEQDLSPAPGDAATGPVHSRVVSPLTGEVVALSAVDDAVFSAGILGDGVAIRPTDGAVRAPISGVVTTLQDSKHAIGIRGDDGVEVLVHVGLDTVQLNGAPFTAHVAQGDRVEAGQLLVTADLAAITAAGFDTVTPVVVVNSADHPVTVHATGSVTAGDALVSAAANSAAANEKELTHGAA